MKTLIRTLFFALFIVPVNLPAQDIDKEVLINDIKQLSSPQFAGRRPGSEGHKKAMAYLIDRFTRLELAYFGESYVDTFAIREGITGHNIIGYIPGVKNEAIVISGHYDHLGQRDGKLFLGADDNASGAAALLSLAAYYKQAKPYYTLIFAAFDAEEMGLRGARAFIEKSPVPLSQIILNVNMDMISRNDSNELYACGTYHYPQLLPYLQISNDLITLKTGHDDPRLGRRDDWTMQSDHGIFHKQGIPFIYFGVEDHPDYHTPNDTFENIHPSFYYQAVRVVLDFLKNVNKAGILEDRKPEKRDLIMH